MACGCIVDGGTGTCVDGVTGGTADEDDDCVGCADGVVLGVDGTGANVTADVDAITVAPFVDRFADIGLDVLGFDVGF